MYDATFDGVQCWYKHAFEKLGWMVLAANRPVVEGEIDKLVMYSQELKHLHQALNEKLENIKEEDRKNDLVILIKNTDKLIKFVDANLKRQVGGARKASKKASKRK
jgi:hypothetical protein